MARAMCRICGAETTYGIGRQGKVHCGKPDCAAASRLTRNAAMRRSPRATCRICGADTKHPADRQGHVNCGKPKCQEASRIQWRANLSANSSWRRLNHVSREEKLIAPSLIERGWTPQLPFVPSIPGAPHTYYLDFALPAKKLCVEVDGRAHRTRVDQDRRRDEILAQLGWQTMRIAASVVNDDLEGTVALISTWVDQLPIVEATPEPVKTCAICGAEMIRPPGARLDRWFKRATCSTKCQGDLYTAKTTGRPHSGYRGTEFVPGHGYIPCRICGKPTYRRGAPDHPMYNVMVCDDLECRAKSKELRRQNQIRTWERRRQDTIGDPS